VPVSNRCRVAVPLTSAHLHRIVSQRLGPRCFPDSLNCSIARSLCQWCLASLTGLSFGTECMVRYFRRESVSQSCGANNAPECGLPWLLSRQKVPRPHEGAPIYRSQAAPVSALTFVSGSITIAPVQQPVPRPILMLVDFK